MSHYQRLKKQLEAKPFLVTEVLSGYVKLIDKKTMMKLKADSGPFSTRSIMDLGKGIDDFARLTGVGKKDREFTLREISKIAGVSYHAAYFYTQEELFSPSIRDFGGRGQGDLMGIFDWSDAFVAGIVGSLRRQGLKVDALRQVGPLLGERKKAGSAKKK